MIKWLKNILAAAVLALLVWYLYRHWHELKVLLRVKPLDLVMLYAIWALGTANNARLFQLIVGALGTRVRLWEMVLLQNAVRLLNHVPMKFGTIFRANYLKQRYGFNYTKSANLLAHVSLLAILTSALVGFVALVARYGISGYEHKILAGCFAVLFVGAVIATFVPLPIPSGSGKLAAVLQRFLTARKGVVRNTGVGFFSLIHLLFALVLGAVRFGIIYRSIGQNIPFSGCLVLSAVGFVSSVASFTPAALGVRELLLGSAAVVLGVTLHVGVLAAMFDRAIMISWVFVAGGCSTLWLWKKHPGEFRKAQMPEPTG